MKTLLTLFVLLVVPATLWSQDDDRRAPLVTDALAAYNTVTRFPLPELDDEKMEKLLGGDVVRERWKQPLVDPTTGEEKERNRVVAFYLVEKPRVLVWMAALDPHFAGNDRITEFRVKVGDEGNNVLYQFANLPWPIRNRHWIVSVRKNRDVFHATNGQAWEHWWTLMGHGQGIAEDMANNGELAESDLTPGDVKDAMYLAANDGAWTTFELGPELTLLTYQVTIDLAGRIPDRLTTRFAMAALEDLCRNVAMFADEVAEHYDDQHVPTFSGDGFPIVPKALTVRRPTAESGSSAAGNR